MRAEKSRIGATLETFQSLQPMRLAQVGLGFRWRPEESRPGEVRVLISVATTARFPEPQQEPRVRSSQTCYRHKKPL